MYKRQKEVDGCIDNNCYIEINYDKDLPLDVLKRNEEVYILDFHIQDDDEFRQLQEVTANITLIDHHKTTIEHREKHPELYENITCNLDTRYSGCELTWMYIYPHDPIPQAVKLISDMDRWVWDYPKTLGFTVGMKLYPHQPWDDIWDELLVSEADDKISSIVSQGETCAKYSDMISDDYCQSYGWETEFEGHKAFAQGMYRGGSKAFGKRIKQYPLCLSYEFVGDKWIVGLYSETIDVSEIAVNHGGGGHKDASGFTCEELPFKKL
jgi:oligoribonuclease NrnB/cAMP/cGMP phosphodiesterase (DHH superfamily)